MGGWSWEALAKRPFFFPVLALAAGLVAGTPTGRVAWPWLLGAGLTGALALWRGPRTGGHTALLMACALAGAGAAGLAARTRTPDALSPGATVTVEGVIEAVEVRDEATTLRLAVERVEGKPATFRATLSCEEELQLAVGQRLLVPARMRPVALPGNAGEWSTAARRLRRGQAWAGHFDARRVVQLSPASSGQRWLAAEHEALGTLVRRVSPDADSAALLLTLAAGQRAELDEGLEEAFARSGLAHVLSVSGLHVAALALAVAWVARRALTWWPGRRLRRVDPRALASWVAVPLAWAYVVYTGTQAPAVRSAVMCTALLLARSLGRRADALNSLAVAAGGMLLVDPSCALDLSVQLSFTAVAALVLLAPGLRELVPLPPPSHLLADGWRYRAWRAGEAALGTLLASLAVTAATVPLVAAAFHRVSLAGLLSNVVSLPLSGVLTLAAAGTAAGHVLLGDGVAPLAWGGAWLARALVEIARAFAAMPGASLAVPPPPWWLGVPWWLGLGAFALARGRARWGAALAPVAALAWWAVVPGPERGELELTFLSVGHGDAVIIQSAGHTLLVDGGGVPGGADPGERVVVPFLRTRRIEHLDLAVLSHPHPDHALGLASALSQVPAARVWLPAGGERGELIRAVEAAAGPAEVERVEAGRAPFPLGDAVVEVLGPPRDRVLLESENDRSVVLRVQHGDVRILLPGDIEEAGEEVLDAGPITVLKAPHHGSRSSSTSRLVDATRPRHVVFCVGAYNRFGFPHEEVEARWTAAGARCWRTDLDGAVTFRSDGRSVTAEPFRQRAPAVGRRRAPVR